MKCYQFYKRQIIFSCLSSLIFFTSLKSVAGGAPGQRHITTCSHHPEQLHLPSPLLSLRLSAVAAAPLTPQIVICPLPNLRLSLVFCGVSCISSQVLGNAGLQGNYSVAVQCGVERPLASLLQRVTAGTWLSTISQQLQPRPGSVPRHTQSFQLSSS